jgi:hypothetical protein
MYGFRIFGEIGLVEIPRPLLYDFPVTGDPRMRQLIVKKHPSAGIHRNIVR